MLPYDKIIDMQGEEFIKVIEVKRIMKKLPFI